MRILTLPDIHEPYNIDLKPILDFCSDWNPDIIQYLGDTTNAESCNPFKINAGIMPDVYSVKEDYDGLERNVLDKFKKASSKKCKTIYYLGNHEKWFYNAMLMDPRLRKLFGVEDNIDVRKYNMEIVPLDTIRKFGHLHFMHGLYINQYHACKTAMNYRRCMVYGHTHDCQEHMIHSPIDKNEKIFAKSIGCLCKMSPGYMKNAPNKWVNAFHIAYIEKDGNFNDYTIILTGGKFISPNGKTYK